MNGLNFVRAYAPATVANLGCGFDCLGFAIELPGDECVVRRSDTSGLRIAAVHASVDLPVAVESNTAGIAAAHLLAQCDEEFGIEIELTKGLEVGTGLGSSAASAAACAVALNRLLDDRFSAVQLIEAVVQAETRVSGAHADNAAASILGGLVMVEDISPLRVRQLPVPPGVKVVLVSPAHPVATADARDVLPLEVPLNDAVANARLLACLVDACHRRDTKTFLSSARDVFIDRHRLGLVPGARRALEVGLAAGAMSAFLSGSGPSVCFLMPTSLDAGALIHEVSDVFARHHLTTHVIESCFGAPGASVLEVG